MSGDPEFGRWWKVIGPDEGRSYWQPQPAGGYVSVNLDPSNTPYDGFSSGVQVLPPGGSVREHGHQRNHELLFVYEGSGRCRIEDAEYDVGPGTTILFGRHARHWIENRGATDMKIFWLFMPPGLEDWFEAIGRPRTPGEAAPAPFERPADVAEVQKQMRFVPPKLR